MHDIFCFTDIHGQYDLYRAIMDYCYEQDPEAMIIFCGDAIDRGKDGYRIMNELLDNPHVVYLMGNHEDMFCKAARQIKELFGFKNPVRENVMKVLSSTMNFDYKYHHIQDSLYNGGIFTLTDWVMDGMPIELVERIEKLPLTFSTDTCDFCHSACVHRSFENVAWAEYNREEPDSYCAESLIWGRTGLGFGWAPNRTAIFGHTPVPLLSTYVHVNWNKDEKVRPIKFYGEKDKMELAPTETGAKIDMDTGAVFTNRIFVLNVLTMKAQGFEKKDKVEKIEVIQF